jgi:putative endonuclease
MPMNDLAVVGRRGEEMAVDYLRGRGYRILERNYHTRRGELDIIAQKAGTLVFVEVKTARSSSYGHPRDWVGKQKQARLVQAAQAYMTEKDIGEMNCRLDVIAIKVCWRKIKLTHIVGAFTA